MTHQRFRPGPDDGLCMVVSAANHIFLAAQTGFALDGTFTGLGDAAAQADQAIRNVVTLLAEAGAALEHIAKIRIYITDRAWREPVDAVLRRHLGDLAPAHVSLIVSGLRLPQMLVALEIDAVIP